MAVTVALWSLAMPATAVMLALIFDAARLVMRKEVIWQDRATNR